jgi:drug/metabolite transporter (DMT)-like permease
MEQKTGGVCVFSRHRRISYSSDVCYTVSGKFFRVGTYRQSGHTLFVKEELVMFNYVWPIAMVVVSNVIYQICAKSVPEGIHPLASLSVTYAVGTFTSIFLYFVLNRGGSLVKEYSKLNWAPFAMGIVVVGLETGFIFAYKAGWQVSTASIVQSSFLSVALIFVGYVLYHEPLTWNKLTGVGICLVGLFIINFK